MVKNFPVVDTHADLCTAHAIGADREVIFQPVDDIQIMNVLLGDMVSADPDEVIPVAHLVFHFGQFASVLLFQVGTLANPWGVAVPVNASRNNITYGTVLKPLDGFDVARLMVALQSSTLRFSSWPLQLLPRPFAPGASVATGFSMKTCLPCFTASSKWMGLNPGGVAE